jgi:radical SAM-linked protein
MAQQRIRAWFDKGERVRFISHLDTLRYWERAIRRAELPLSYSHGFTPHPKLAFAGPLPLGYLGRDEVVDVTLDDRLDPAEFLSRVGNQTTPDLHLTRAAEVALSTPAPQASLLWADYTVQVPGVACDELARAAAAFMARCALPWTEERHDRTRTYDLRATVAAMETRAMDGGTLLCMRLQADQRLMARPEQVLAAVLPGIEHGLITRCGLYFDEPSPAREAYRRRGRFEE